MPDSTLLTRDTLSEFLNSRGHYYNLAVAPDSFKAAYEHFVDNAESPEDADTNAALLQQFEKEDREKRMRMASSALEVVPEGLREQFYTTRSGEFIDLRTGQKYSPIGLMQHPVVSEHIQTQAMVDEDFNPASAFIFSMADTLANISPDAIMSSALGAVGIGDSQPWIAPALGQALGLSDSRADFAKARQTLRFGLSDEEALTRYAGASGDIAGFAVALAASGGTGGGGAATGLIGNLTSKAGPLMTRIIGTGGSRLAGLYPMAKAGFLTGGETVSERLKGAIGGTTAFMAGKVSSAIFAPLIAKTGKMMAPYLGIDVMVGGTAKNAAMRFIGQRAIPGLEHFLATTPGFMGLDVVHQLWAGGAEAVDFKEAFMATLVGMGMFDLPAAGVRSVRARMKGISMTDALTARTLTEVGTGIIRTKAGKVESPEAYLSQRRREGYLDPYQFEIAVRLAEDGIKQPQKFFRHLSSSPNRGVGLAFDALKLEALHTAMTGQRENQTVSNDKDPNDPNAPGWRLEPDAPPKYERSPDPWKAVGVDRRKATFESLIQKAFTYYQRAQATRDPRLRDQLLARYWLVFEEAVNRSTPRAANMYWEALAMEAQANTAFPVEAARWAKRAEPLRQNARLMGQVEEQWQEVNRALLILQGRPDLANKVIARLFGPETAAQVGDNFTMAMQLVRAAEAGINAARNSIVQSMGGGPQGQQPKLLGAGSRPGGMGAAPIGPQHGDFFGRGPGPQRPSGPTLPGPFAGMVPQAPPPAPAPPATAAEPAAPAGQKKGGKKDKAKKTPEPTIIDPETAEIVINLSAGKITPEQAAKQITEKMADDAAAEDVATELVPALKSAIDKWDNGKPAEAEAELKGVDFEPQAPTAEKVAKAKKVVKAVTNEAPTAPEKSADPADIALRKKRIGYFLREAAKPGLPPEVQQTLLQRAWELWAADHPGQPIRPEDLSVLVAWSAAGPEAAPSWPTSPEVGPKPLPPGPLAPPPIARPAPVPKKKGPTDQHIERAKAGATLRRESLRRFTQAETAPQTKEESVEIVDLLGQWQRGEIPFQHLPPQIQKSVVDQMENMIPSLVDQLQQGTLNLDRLPPQVAMRVVAELSRTTASQPLADQWVKAAGARVRDLLAQARTFAEQGKPVEGRAAFEEAYNLAAKLATRADPPGSPLATLVAVSQTGPYTVRGGRVMNLNVLRIAEDLGMPITEAPHAPSRGRQKPKDIRPRSRLDVRPEEAAQRQWPANPAFLTKAIALYDMGQLNEAVETAIDGNWLPADTPVFALGRDVIDKMFLDFKAKVEELRAPITAEQPGPARSTTENDLVPEAASDGSAPVKAAASAVVSGGAPAPDAATQAKELLILAQAVALAQAGPENNDKAKFALDSINFLRNLDTPSRLRAAEARVGALTSGHGELAARLDGVISRAARGEPDALSALGLQMPVGADAAETDRRIQMAAARRAKRAKRAAEDAQKRREVPLTGPEAVVREAVAEATGILRAEEKAAQGETGSRLDRAMARARKLRGSTKKDTRFEDIGLPKELAEQVDWLAEIGILQASEAWRLTEGQRGGTRTWKDLERVLLSLGIPEQAETEHHRRMAAKAEADLTEARILVKNGDIAKKQEDAGIEVTPKSGEWYRQAMESAAQHMPELSDMHLDAALNEIRRFREGVIFKGELQRLKTIATMREANKRTTEMRKKLDKDINDWATEKEETERKEEFTEEDVAHVLASISWKARGGKKMKETSRPLSSIYNTKGARLKGDTLNPNILEETRIGQLVADMIKYVQDPGSTPAPKISAEDSYLAFQLIDAVVLASNKNQPGADKLIGAAHDLISGIVKRNSIAASMLRSPDPFDVVTALTMVLDHNMNPPPLELLTLRSTLARRGEGRKSVKKDRSGQRGVLAVGFPFVDIIQHGYRALKGLKPRRIDPSRDGAVGPHPDEMKPHPELEAALDAIAVGDLPKAEEVVKELTEKPEKLLALFHKTRLGKGATLAEGLSAFASKEGIQFDMPNPLWSQVRNGLTQLRSMILTPWTESWVTMHRDRRHLHAIRMEAMANWARDRIVDPMALYLRGASPTERKAFTLEFLRLNEGTDPAVAFSHLDQRGRAILTATKRLFDHYKDVLKLMGVRVRKGGYFPLIRETLSQFYNDPHYLKGLTELNTRFLKHRARDDYKGVETDIGRVLSLYINGVERYLAFKPLEQFWTKIKRFYGVEGSESLKPHKEAADAKLPMIPAQTAEWVDRMVQLWNGAPGWASVHLEKLAESMWKHTAGRFMGDHVTGRELISGFNKLHFIGAFVGSFGSGLRNMTQLSTTFSELNVSSVADAAFSLGVRRGVNGIELNVLLKDMGLMESGYISNLASEHGPSFRRSLGTLSEIGDALMTPFTAAEWMLRAVTGLAAYKQVSRSLKKQGGLTRADIHAKALDAARDIIDRTQFDFSRFTTGRAFTGSAGKLFLQFKRFDVGMLDYIQLAARRALGSEKAHRAMPMLPGQTAIGTLVKYMASPFIASTAFGLLGIGLDETQGPLSNLPDVMRAGMGRAVEEIYKMAGPDVEFGGDGQTDARPAGRGLTRTLGLAPQARTGLDLFFMSVGPFTAELASVMSLVAFGTSGKAAREVEQSFRLVFPGLMADRIRRFLQESKEGYIRSRSTGRIMYPDPAEGRLRTDQIALRLFGVQPADFHEELQLVRDALDVETLLDEKKGDIRIEMIKRLQGGEEPEEVAAALLMALDDLSQDTYRTFTPEEVAEEWRLIKARKAEFDEITTREKIVSKRDFQAMKPQ